MDVTSKPDQMTRTDHLQWVFARVERVEMTSTVRIIEGNSFPTMKVEMHYVWKARRFSKKVESVLN